MSVFIFFTKATIGKCNTPKPSMVDFVGRAKWNAWSELDMSQVKLLYIKIKN